MAKTGYPHHVTLDDLLSNKNKFLNIKRLKKIDDDNEDEEEQDESEDENDYEDDDNDDEDDNDEEEDEDDNENDEDSDGDDEEENKGKKLKKEKGNEPKEKRMTKEDKERVRREKGYYSFITFKAGGELRKLATLSEIKKVKLNSSIVKLVENTTFIGYANHNLSLLFSLLNFH